MELILSDNFANVFFWKVVAHRGGKDRHSGSGEGRRGGKGRREEFNTPGCENATSVKDIKPADCCPGLPKTFNETVWKSCEESCKDSENGFCCKSDCMTKTIFAVDSTGKFDSDKSKEILKAAVNGSADWVRKSSKCFYNFNEILNSISANREHR